MNRSESSSPVTRSPLTRGNVIRAVRRFHTASTTAAVPAASSTVSNTRTLSTASGNIAFGSRSPRSVVTRSVSNSRTLSAASGNTAFGSRTARSRVTISATLSIPQPGGSGTLTTNRERTVVPGSRKRNIKNVRVEKEVQTDESQQTNFPVNKLKRKRQPSLSHTFLPCAICFDEMLQEGKHLTCLKCGHVFCTDCLEKCLEKNKLCPLCLKPMLKRDFRRVFL